MLFIFAAYCHLSIVSLYTQVPWLYNFWSVSGPWTFGCPTAVLAMPDTRPPVLPPELPELLELPELPEFPEFPESPLDVLSHIAYKKIWSISPEYALPAFLSDSIAYCINPFG